MCQNGISIPGCGSLGPRGKRWNATESGDRGRSCVPSWIPEDREGGDLRRDRNSPVANGEIFQD